MSTEGFICPRRSEVAPHFRPESDDAWRDDETCSFCGSLRPAVFIELAAAGQALSPTDKNYKANIAGSRSPTGKVYFQHFSEQERTRLVELLNSAELVFEHPGRFYVLPYFIQRQG